MLQVHLKMVVIIAIKRLRFYHQRVVPKARLTSKRGQSQIPKMICFDSAQLVGTTVVLLMESSGMWAS